MPSSSPADPSEPRREPVFNAPALALLLAVSMPALFYLQIGRPDEGMLIYRYGLIPARMGEGGGVAVITHMLLHGGWAHALMNAVGALAFGAPLARMMTGVKGALGFLSFYVACGVIAGVGYALIHIESETPMIGASGAVFGLIGAATRMMGARGGVAPLKDRRVLGSAAAWIGANVFIGLIGFAPGVEGARIAWEAHVIGLIAGLILIGPWAGFFASRNAAPPSGRDDAFDSPPRMSDSDSAKGPWGP